MSYDGLIYKVAEQYLKEAGYNNTIDMDKLAQAIQDTIEDYLCDLDARDVPELEDR